MSADNGASERDAQIAEYNELFATLQEAEELLLTSEGDEEVEELIAQTREQLSLIAQQLNRSESVDVTRGLTRKTSTEDGVAFIDSGSAASATTAAAPYEILFDEKSDEWYACFITDVVPPVQSSEKSDANWRVQYKVYILGYRVYETVTSERLRPWTEGSGTLSTQLTSGTKCAAVHPRTGKFAPACIDHLTLHSTALVEFSKEGEGEDEDEDGSSAKQSTAVEVPLSHIRLGKIYPELRKRRELTEEEKAKRREATLKRKREMREDKKQMTADVVAQNANDWKRMMSDLGVGGSGRAGADKKRRRI